MKGLRFLLLSMAICLASGVKAQFYDSADDIYYYVEYKDGNFVENGNVRIFNFDGQKAAVLNSKGNYFESIANVKSNIASSPDYYESKVETTEYSLKYKSYNSYSFRLSFTEYTENANPAFGTTPTNVNDTYTYKFSSDRIYCYEEREGSGYHVNWGRTEKRNFKKEYKKVDKSYFKVGRSRTPSGTMHE